MKKSKTMRAASFLLVLTLMTSCFVGSTFAKYTTTTTGSDNARVAYWGWDAPAKLDISLFDGTYANVASQGTIDEITQVIAPGTSDTAEFAFSWTEYSKDEEKISLPEVAYDFTVTPTITGNYAALDANNNFKWTLQKKVGDVTSAVGAGEFNTVSELLAEIKNLSGAATGTQRYDAGYLPTAFTAADEIYIVGWEWAFANTSGDESAKIAQDVADTKMGNALATAGVLDNITFSITINATQVD